MNSNRFPIIISDTRFQIFQNWKTLRKRTVDLLRKLKTRTGRQGARRIRDRENNYRWGIVTDKKIFVKTVVEREELALPSQNFPAAKFSMETKRFAAGDSTT